MILVLTKANFDTLLLNGCSNFHDPFFLLLERARFGGGPVQISLRTIMGANALDSVNVIAIFLGHCNFINFTRKCLHGEQQ